MKFDYSLLILYLRKSTSISEFKYDLRGSKRLKKLNVIKRAQTLNGLIIEQQENLFC